MVEKRIIKFDRLKISNYDRYKDEFDFKLFLLFSSQIKAMSLVLKTVLDEP